MRRSLGTIALLGSGWTWKESNLSPHQTERHRGKRGRQGPERRTRCPWGPGRPPQGIVHHDPQDSRCLQMSRCTNYSPVRTVAKKRTVHPFGGPARRKEKSTDWHKRTPHHARKNQGKTTKRVFYSAFLAVIAEPRAWHCGFGRQGSLYMVQTMGMSFCGITFDKAQPKVPNARAKSTLLSSWSTLFRTTRNLCRPNEATITRAGVPRLELEHLGE